MKRLKVLFITGGYPTKKEPAASIFVHEHAKAVQLYNDVVVLHSAGSIPNLKGLWRLEQETEETLTNGITVYRVWCRHLSIPGVSYLIYLWSVFRAFRQIVTQGFRPDIIHAHVYASGIPAVIIGKLYQVPVVITEQWSAFPMKILPRLEVLKARLAFRYAKIVLPVSQALQGAIENYGIRAKFQVIPNVFDPTVFFPSKINYNNEKSDIKHMLFVGLLVPIKGLPYLFQALAKLKFSRDDWHLDIIGDGPEKAEYERSITELKIKDEVAFHGLKSKREVAEFMRKCDFYIQPSLYETFGAVLIEAMACGKPVIATNAGGPKEFINKKNGILVPSKDINALLKAINYMLNHYQNFSPEEISQYAKENFSYKIVGEKINGVYKKILKKL